jgi:lipopolysaccharide export system ATP-binding protein
LSIVAKNLVKAYNQRRVVDDVSIKVDRGEVVGLLGPNGAGKTTTFYMIVGVESADSGQIFLDGQDVTHLSMYKRALQGIGYLPQEPSVFRKLSVEDNIMAILEARGFSYKEQVTRTNELIEEFKLDVVRKTKGFRLSGGERRRTEIARALAADPSFILLDEPFAGVDPIAVADIQEIIEMLREKQLGVLITDHNVRETLSITDRAYIMHEGRILVAGNSKTIASDPDARRFYLGESFSL